MVLLQAPAFEDEASLYSLATEYLEAADFLAHSSAEKLNFSLVTFHLAGHAAELLVKSLLHKHGVSIQDLKQKYGHDLAKLVREVTEKKLLAPVSLSNVCTLSEAYMQKHTEYRQMNALSLPQIDLLIQELRSLQTHVFSKVSWS